MRPLLALAITGCCLAASSSPDAQEIVRRSVQAVEADWNQAPNYSYRERDVESKHNAQATTKTYQVLMIDGSPYNRLVAVDDRPLASSEQTVEDRKLHNEARKRESESAHERAKRVAKYEKERHHDHAMLLDMIQVFDFEPAGEETVDGHACWVFDAQPKHGYQPKDHETKVLLGMRGRLWIDKSQYQWVRVKAEVVKPVGFFGFIAKVGPGTRFLLEQEPVADNLWLPKSFSVHVKASALGFIDESSIDDETYTAYVPMAKVSAMFSTH